MIYKKEQISQKKVSKEWAAVEGSDLRTGKVGRAEKMKIGGVHKKKKGKEFAALKWHFTTRLCMMYTIC